MTLQEYVISLQNQNLSQEEIYTKVEEWKKNNPQPQVEEEVEEVVEEKPIPLTIASATEPIEPEINTDEFDFKNSQNNINKLETDLIQISGGDMEMDAMDSPNRIKMYNDTLTELNKSIEDYNTALRSVQDEEQIEKDKIAKKSYLEKLATVDLAKGSTTLGEMMFSLGESFYDIFSWPQNALVDAGILPKKYELSSKKFKEEFGITNPLLEFYQKESEKLGKEQAIWNNENYDTKGIYENFKKGNWSDGFKQLGSGLAESAPVSIGMMAGGSATSIPRLAAGSTPMFLGPELERLREENPGASEFDLTAKAIGLAGAETVFSAIGSGTLGKVYKDILLKEGKQQGAKVFRNGLIEMYEQALKKAGAPAGALGEGIEEVATQITQNMINGKDPFEGVNDAFLQGLGGGATYAGPINVIQVKQGIQEAVAINKINKSVAKINPDFNVNNIAEVYSTPVDLSKPISGLEELKIAQTPKAKTILDQQVTKDLELGKINQEQANSIQENFRDVTQATQQLKPLGLNENVEAASLLIEKNKLQQKIKQVNDSALTTQETDRVNEINTRLKEISFEKQTEKTKEGSDIIASELNVPIFRGNTKDVENKLKDLREKGGNVDEKNSTNYGTIVTMEDGSQEIVINQEVAAEDNVVTTDQHEVLHALVNNADDSFKTKLGKDLYQELINNPDIEVNETITAALENYANDPNYTDAMLMEEVMALTSEGLTSGEIKIKENALTKIGDFIRRALQSLGINVSFKNGKDVLNFIKDYNRDIVRGKGLSKGVKKAVAGMQEGKTITQPKASKPASVVTPLAQELIKEDNALLQQALISEIKTGGETRFDTAQAITEKNWGLISPLLNINSQQEMNAAKEVVIDQLMGTFEGSGQGKYSARNTSALEGFSLDPDAGSAPAQVSTYLVKTIRTRKPEIDAAIADRTGRSGQELQQAGGEVVTETETIDTTKLAKKPSETTGLEPETETRITEAVQKVYKGKDVKFSETRNIPKEVADIYGEEFGINPQTITDKTRNFQKTDADGLTKAKQFLLKNAKDDFARLPKTKDDFGKGTFVPKNVRDALYTDGKLTGSLKDYMDLIRTKPEKVIYRDRVGQTIRGLLGLHIRNRILETAQPSQAKRVQSGAKFAKRRKPKSKTDGKNVFDAKRLQDLGKVGRIGVGQVLKDNNISRLTFKTGEDRVQQVKDGKLVFSKKDKPKFLRADQLTDKGRKIRNETTIASLPKLGLDFFSVGFYDNNAMFSSKADFDSIFDTALSQEFIEKNNLQSFVKTNSDGIITLDKNKIKNIKGIRIQDGVDKKGNPIYKNTIKDAAKEQKNYKKIPPNKRESTLKNKDFQQLQKDKIKVLENVASVIEQEIRNEDGSVNTEKAAFWAEWLGTSSALSTHPIRSLAPITFFSNSKLKATNDYVAEHTMPANIVSTTVLDMALKGRVKTDFKFIKNNYQQGQLLKTDDVKVNIFYKVSAPQEFFNNENSSVWIRYAHTDLNSIDTEGGINLNEYITTNNKGEVVTVAESLGLSLDKSQYKDKAGNDIAAVIHYQNELIYDLQVDGELKSSTLKKKLDIAVPVKKSEQTQVNKNADKLGGPLKQGVTPDAAKKTMLNSFETKVKASKLESKRRGISVFDFDDTLARTKEKVIVNMPNGITKEISAAEFAKQADLLTENGATFDFTNFENVSKITKEGPLADLARKRQDKFGSKDIFVLTARPQISAASIKTFLDAIGINIPLKNITGLEDGSPQAKADWVLNKTAEGYNDFYFADDSFANVAGVKAVLDAVDVKNKVQQAKASKRRNLDKDFNRQLEQVTGKEAFKKYSDARGRLEGQQKDKGAFKRFIKQFTITPSAEDFMGLMYAFMGKGAQGNAHAKFIKENLMDPYNKAEQELISAQVSVANDFAELKKQFPNLRSKRGKNPLLEEIGVGPYSKSQAIRVYMWNKQGMDIPGMSQRDINALVKAVEADNELNVFADEVALIQKGEQYPAPTQNWLSGNIASDIMQGLKTGFRKKLMTEFNENADIIFSKENLNKIEAIYGSKFREALEDSLRRMRTGSNRPVFVGGGARIVNEMLDWLNASVGAVMFFNMRSGLLQLISNVNFINWGDNNIYDAAKAFVSKDYFPTVLKLLNSDYLINRRDGLKINVNEAELTDAGRKGGVKGMINYLLDKGFAITRIMDSVAIATGGATFFINRKKSLQNRVNKDTGELYTEAEADQQAFDDFYAIAEETQQSSNPSKISAQQASFAGRIILSFQNVTMQYNRKTKKSIKDLYNRRTKPGMTQRESDLSNLSSIIYYVGVQNLIFNAMQQALFGLAFDDEPDEDEKDKAASIVNGMADSLLFGLGFGGAIISTVKNVLMRIASESEKKTTQYRDAVWNVFDISPVLDSKVRKLRTAAKTFDWNMKEIKKRGWSIDNPAYLAVAQIISATTNLPIDRALQKLNNLRQATDEETKTWQRVALALGWSGWNFGLPYWGRQSTIDKEAKDEEKIKEKFKKDVNKAKAMGFTKRVPFTGPKSGKPSGKLGVDYVAIERYDGLIQYYKKP